MDVYFSPKTMIKSDHQQPIQTYYSGDQRSLFILGSVWAYHLSHFFVNNAMPLYNMLYMQNGYNADWRSWKDRDLLVVSGGASLFDKTSLDFKNVWIRGEKAAADSTTLRCYQKVIVGLNSTCDCCGCLKDYQSSSIIHNITRDIVLSKHLTGEELKAVRARDALPFKARRPFHLAIVDRLHNRRILNLPQVSQYLKARGTPFSILNLEHMSFRDQVRFFALNASMLMATHGNSLGNAFWMSPGSAVVEVHSYDQGSAWFEHIFSDANDSQDPSQRSLIEYNVIKCKKPECKDPHSSGFNSNAMVEIDKLDVLLDHYNKV